MAVSISEEHFRQIKAALYSLASYLEEKALVYQEAVEHLTEIEEAINTLESAEIDRAYEEIKASGAISTPGGS